MNYYDILRLKSSATQNEIKRAYFKLIREHSPESDPEGFRKIREAYEYLKSAPAKEEGPSFPPFKEPFAQRIADQITQAMRVKNYVLARDTAQEGWKYFPDELFFLYWLTIAQRKCGNTGKSVKSGELLVKKDPGNKWFWREYGVSLMERGYVNKAFDPLFKAYDLGIRDLDFVLLFATECDDFGQRSKTVEILLEVVRRENKWKREEIPYIISAYQGLVYHIYNDSGWKNRDEIFRRYCEFTKTYHTLFQNNISDSILLLCHLFDRLSPEWTHDYQTLLGESLVSLGSSVKDSHDQENLDDLKLQNRSHFILSDDRLCPPLQFLAQGIKTNDPSILKYVEMDRKLCLIKERETVLASEDLLKEEYPDFYSDIQDYLDLLRDEDKALETKAVLLPQLAKISGYISGLNYFEWYPDEKEKAFGKHISSGEETYQRANKKIGRNDPCPCGSGKKFKKCCMGKGIYD